MSKSLKTSQLSGQIAFTEFLLEVFKLNGLLLAEEDRLVQPLGLTSARCKVLGTITRAGQALTVPQIGRRMGGTRQNIQRLVDVLEEEGFVHCQDNPDHKRAKLVLLTKKGEERYAAMLQAQIPWANRSTQSIKRADLDNTLNVLRALVGQRDRV